MDKNFSIRFGSAEDVPLIFRFIKELAEYEKMLDEVGYMTFRRLGTPISVKD